MCIRCRGTLILAGSPACDARCLETVARNFPNALILLAETTTLSTSHALQAYIYLSQSNS